MTYEALLMEADQCGLIVKEKNLNANSGRINGHRIAIKKDIHTAEKACTLAEELGHHFTTVGNIVDYNDLNNYKQELSGRVWAYNKQIGLLGIIRAFENGCQSSYETAEFLEVTEEFLNGAVSYYRSRYGLYATIDNYAIFFEPTIDVLKMY